MSSALTMAYGISIAGISLGSGWLIETSGYPALFGGFDTDNLARCALFSYLFSHASWRIRK